MANNIRAGYKNPPIETQFKPGFSGNHNGRPKGSKRLNAILDKTFNQKITLADGRKVSKIQIAATNLINSAAKGNFRDIKLSLELMAKIQRSSLAESFFNKFLSEKYISEESASDYVNNRVQKPDISHKPIKAIEVKNMLLFCAADWLMVISEIYYILDLYELTYKIFCSVCFEYQYWEGIEDLLSHLGYKEEEKSRIIEDFEAKREYKRPTYEMLATAINLKIKVQNQYNLYMKTNRDLYGLDYRYRAKQKAYFENVIKENFEQIRKQNLSPEKLKMINDYEKKSEENYNHFMNNDFKQIEPFSFEVTESISDLLDWYSNKK